MLSKKKKEENTLRSEDVFGFHGDRARIFITIKKQNKTENITKLQWFLIINKIRTNISVSN